MSTYTIKPITETSWILNKSGEKLAIISQTANEVLLLGNVPKKKHKSLDELVKYLGDDVTIEEPAQIEIEKEAAEIKGYPIKHEVWYDVAEEGIPRYTRTKNAINSN